MERFREWLSDNLRYILLGLVIILVLAAAVFAVKLISGLGSGEGTQKESQKQTETKKEVIVESNTSTEKPGNDFTQNDQKLLTAVQTYYAAMQNKDIEALKKIVPNLTEEEKQSVLSDDLIESYNNISTYSRSAVQADTYVVYVIYDCKVANIDTQVPSLARLYFQTNSDGSLFVGDYKSDEKTKQFVDGLAENEQVKNLISDVSSRYQKAVNANADLKNLIDQGGTAVSEPNLADSSDAEVHKVVAANTECNVRADSSEESDIIGALYTGDEVTRVRELDNGWSEIKYNGGTAYVMSDFLTETPGNSTAQ